MELNRRYWAPDNHERLLLTTTFASNYFSEFRSSYLNYKNEMHRKPQVNDLWCKIAFKNLATFFSIASANESLNKIKSFAETVRTNKHIDDEKFIKDFYFLLKHFLQDTCCSIELLLGEIYHITMQNPSKKSFGSRKDKKKFINSLNTSYKTLLQRNEAVFDEIADYRNILIHSEPTLFHFNKHKYDYFLPKVKVYGGNYKLKYFEFLKGRNVFGIRGNINNYRRVPVDRLFDRYNRKIIYVTTRIWNLLRGDFKNISW